MPKILTIIPARGGSKRLPGKNLRTFASGLTLLDISQQAIAESGVETDCLLSTDHSGIADRGRKLGWQVPFLRPAILAADDVPTLPVIMHALDWYRDQCGNDPGIVMVLQVTSPFRKGCHIARAVEMLQKAPSLEAIVGMRRIDIAPAFQFVLNDDKQAQVLAPDDLRCPIYVPNGSFYLIRTASLRCHQTLFPPVLLPFEMDDVASLDIDTETDWRIAEALFAAGY